MLFESSESSNLFDCSGKKALAVLHGVPGIWLAMECSTTQLSFLFQVRLTSYITRPTYG